MHAVRNVKLCTKDCLCLYVCPTGATDTEDGQIDAKTCLSGCRACVDACPSHAISLVPEEFPAAQVKKDASIDMLLNQLKSKSKQHVATQDIAQKTDDPIIRQLATAISKSNMLMAEDLIREAGFLLPQDETVKSLLKSLIKDNREKDFPIDDVKRLLEIL